MLLLLLIRLIIVNIFEWKKMEIELIINMIPIMDRKEGSILSFDFFGTCSCFHFLVDSWTNDKS